MSFRPVFLSVQLFVDDRLDALLREGRVLVKQPVPHEHEVRLPMLLPEYASAGPRAQRLRAPAAQMAYHRWSTAVSGGGERQGRRGERQRALAALLSQSLAES